MAPPRDKTGRFVSEQQAETETKTRPADADGDGRVTVGEYLRHKLLWLARVARRHDADEVAVQLLQDLADDGRINGSAK